MWKVTWAHPEFGQVLATCSFDRSVAVWEEQGTHKLHIQSMEGGAVALQNFATMVSCCSWRAEGVTTSSYSDSLGKLLFS